MPCVRLGGGAVTVAFAMALTLTVAVHASELSPVENARIEYLLSAVASLQGAQFVAQWRAL